MASTALSIVPNAVIITTARCESRCLAARNTPSPRIRFNYVALICEEINEEGSHLLFVVEHEDALPGLTRYRCHADSPSAESPPASVDVLGCAPPEETQQSAFHSLPRSRP